MSNDFENARHQGFTAADMAAEQAEATQRMQVLGCFSCKYGAAYRACNTIIEGDYDKCPYFKKEV